MLVQAEAQSVSRATYPSLPIDPRSTLAYHCCAATPPAQPSPPTASPRLLPSATIPFRSRSPPIAPPADPVRFQPRPTPLPSPATPATPSPASPHLRHPPCTAAPSCPSLALPFGGLCYSDGVFPEGAAAAISPAPGRPAGGVPRWSLPPRRHEAGVHPVQKMASSPSCSCLSLLRLTAAGHHARALQGEDDSFSLGARGGKVSLVRIF
jgi:hypothetical protein